MSGALALFSEPSTADQASACSSTVLRAGGTEDQASACSSTVLRAGGSTGAHELLAYTDQWRSRSAADREAVELAARACKCVVVERAELLCLRRADWLRVAEGTDAQSEAELSIGGGCTQWVARCAWGLLQRNRTAGGCIALPWGRSEWSPALSCARPPTRCASAEV